VIRHVDEHPSALKGMTNWCYAGDAMPVNPLNKGIGRFGRVFSGYYGLLESGLAGSTFLSEDHVAVDGDERRLRSAGRPTLGIEMRVVDLESGEDVARDGQAPGEIWIRSPTVMKGYWRRPDLTAERVQDGWLRTNDVATWDEDGFLYLVDRATDMIITGGINVFPRDVENVIRRHPDVDQVAVVGMPSDEWGQVITACLTLASPRDEDALRDEVLQLCSGELAGYKKPRRLVVRDDLPMTGSGKVNKATLRTLLADQLGAR
jgi:acyl-CoA synthetase (AMP-forming)/AMP-acid ligase II